MKTAFMLATPKAVTLRLFQNVAARETNVGAVNLEIKSIHLIEALSICRGATDVGVTNIGASFWELLAPWAAKMLKKGAYPVLFHYKHLTIYG